MKRLVIFIAIALASFQAFAQNDYNASYFGIKSNGTTDNTASIQKAVDFISEKGGGTLTFWVGRYVTGAVELKDNVQIRLREGAVIVGSTNIYSYKGQRAIFWAEGRKNVSIYDNGVIDGRGPELLKNMKEQKDKGYLSDSVPVPTLVYLKDCTESSLKNFILRNPATAPDLYVVVGGDVVVDGCYTDTK